MRRLAGRLADAVSSSPSSAASTPSSASGAAAGGGAGHRHRSASSFKDDDFFKSEEGDVAILKGALYKKRDIVKKWRVRLFALLPTSLQ